MIRFATILAIVFGVILIIWVPLRVTKTLEFYNTASPANEPTIKTGTKVFTSNLKKPKRHDFICFHPQKEGFEKEVWFFRICGLSGDTVEMRNGDLFVNGQYADHLLNIAHSYIISNKDFKAILPEEVENKEVAYAFNIDSMSIDLSDQLVKDLQISARRFLFPADQPDDEIQALYEAPWNADHFGPVVVPFGQYFVLGDNRHRALDSRYIGFVDPENVVGTVLGDW